MTKVSIVRCRDYDPNRVFDAVRKAINLAGGLDSFEEGKKVLLKPNVLGNFPPEKAVTTHPAVVEGVIRVLQDKGLEVCIGESSGSRAKGGTERALRVSGMECIAKERGIEIIDFDTDEHVNLTLKDNTSGNIQHLRISKKLAEVDYIVNVPKLKTHNLTGYTGAIKNMFGIIPGRCKTTLHSKGKTIGGFSEILVDVYQTISPQLTVMDAVVGMEGRGPAHGNLKQTDLIFSSFNGSALDFVVSQFIGFNALEIKMIKIAKERGLFNESNIEVVGNGRDVKVYYKRPSLNPSGKMFGFFIGLLKPSFRADEDLCRRCYQCLEACPEDAIHIGKSKYPVWNRKKCITCYCCDELCPSDAVVMEKPLLVRITDKITRRYND